MSGRRVIVTRVNSDWISAKKMETFEKLPMVNDLYFKPLALKLSKNKICKINDTAFIFK